MEIRKNQRAFLRSLGERIRGLRVDKGWSQEQLAFECNLHRTYIGSIERGERNISILNLAAIARALNISVQDLFSEKN